MSWDRVFIFSRLTQTFIIPTNVFIIWSEQINEEQTSFSFFCFSHLCLNYAFLLTPVSHLLCLPFRLCFPVFQSFFFPFLSFCPLFLSHYFISFSPPSSYSASVSSLSSPLLLTCSHFVPSLPLFFPSCPLLLFFLQYCSSFPPFLQLFISFQSLLIFSFWHCFFSNPSLLTSLSSFSFVPLSPPFSKSHSSLSSPYSSVFFSSVLLLFYFPSSFFSFVPFSPHFSPFHHFLLISFHVFLVITSSPNLLFFLSFPVLPPLPFILSLFPLLLQARLLWSPSTASPSHPPPSPAPGCPLSLISTPTRLSVVATMTASWPRRWDWWGASLR